MMFPKRVRLLFAVFACVLLFGGVLILLSGPTPESRELAPTPTSFQSDLSQLLEAGPAHTVFPTENTGVLEGELLHPISIPEGLRVCAVNQESFAETCTSDLVTHPSYIQGVGFRLSVSPGTYTLYAQDPEYDFRAYHTPFAECGIHPECQDHTPTRITVGAGEIVSNLQPTDWTDAPFLR